MKRRYNELLTEHLNEQDLSPLTPSLEAEVRILRAERDSHLEAFHRMTKSNEYNCQERDALRSQLEEAVALLRAVDKPFHSMALIEIHAFLSRLISGGTR